MKPLLKILVRLSEVGMWFALVLLALFAIVFSVNGTFYLGRSSSKIRRME